MTRLHIDRAYKKNLLENYEKLFEIYWLENSV